jgi:DNA repair ATPase RecN
MEYNKLVAVTGLPGLYELVSSKSDGAIVRSLDDGSTKFAATRSHNFSHLESIEIYTQRDNVNLVEIFNAIEKAGGSLPDTKDNGKLKKYFEKVYPEMDFEKVYASDMKKMIKWYEQLKKHNIEIKLTEVPEEAVEEAEEVKEPEPVEEAPKKKTTRKKKAE